MLLTYIGDMFWSPCSSPEAPKPLDLSASSDGNVGESGGREGERESERAYSGGPFRNKQLLTASTKTKVRKSIFSRLFKKFSK